MAGVLSDVGPASAQEAPSITARDVVDQDTLKGFVQGAIGFLGAQFESGEAVDIDALKAGFQDGTWSLEARVHLLRCAG